MPKVIFARGGGLLRARRGGVNPVSYPLRARWKHALTFRFLQILAFPSQIRTGCWEGPDVFGGKPAPEAFLLQLQCRHPLCAAAAKCCRQPCVLEMSCAASYLPPLSVVTAGVLRAGEAQG